jgi:hypothetical protein
MKDGKRSCSAATRRAIRSWGLEKMVSLAPHRVRRFIAAGCACCVGEVPVAHCSDCAL